MPVPSSAKLTSKSEHGANRVGYDGPVRIHHAVVSNQGTGSIQCPVEDEGSFRASLRIREIARQSVGRVEAAGPELAKLFQPADGGLHGCDFQRRQARLAVDTARAEPRIFRSLQVFGQAGWLMAKGPASSFTDACKREIRCRIARRVGSASAAKTVSSNS